jgi:hypothetical protein
MRFLFTALLIGHGWVHGVMWALPFSDEALADLPMDPSHSWLLGDSRVFAFGLAMVTAVALVMAGITYAVDVSWWPGVSIGAASLSLVLMSLYFSPWWLLGYLIDMVIVVVASRELNAS